jgi:hypothetical protein
VIQMVGGLVDRSEVSSHGVWSWQHSSSSHHRIIPITHDTDDSLDRDKGQRRPINHNRSIWIHVRKYYRRTAGLRLAAPSCVSCVKKSFGRHRDYSRHQLK